MPSQSQFICLTGKPNEATHWMLQPGDTVLHAQSGTFFHDLNGNDTSISVPTITGVAVANPADVAGIDVLRTPTTVTKRVRFHGGGEASVVFALDGAIVEVLGDRIASFTDSSGFMRLGLFGTAVARPTSAELRIVF